MELFPVWLVMIVLGIFGIIIGSFLNVVILRVGTGKGFGGRSGCFSCNHQLRWYELIPVVSFLIQRGRCRSCGSKISRQYIFVECATAILFAITGFFVIHPMMLMVWLLMISLGMVIAVYDIHHHMILWKPLLVMLVIGFFIQGSLVGSLLGMIIVPIPMLIIWFITKKKGIGFGDIEIMVVMGVTLGITGGFSAVMIAFWLATAIMIPWVLLKKRTNGLRHYPIAFGPFLLIALYIVGVAKLDIVKQLLTMVY